MYSTNPSDVIPVTIHCNDGNIYTTIGYFNGIVKKGSEISTHVLEAREISCDEVKQVLGARVTTCASMVVANRWNVVRPSIMRSAVDAADLTKYLHVPEYVLLLKNVQKLGIIKKENCGIIENNFSAEILEKLLKISNDSFMAAIRIAWVTGDYSFMTVCGGCRREVTPAAHDAIKECMPLLEYRVNKGNTFDGMD